jgi:hypothetical protein
MFLRRRDAEKQVVPSIVCVRPVKLTLNQSTIDDPVVFEALIRAYFRVFRGRVGEDGVIVIGHPHVRRGAMIFAAGGAASRQIPGGAARLS